MIPYGRQSIIEEDIAAVAEVLRGDWLTTGPYVAAFEQDIAAVAGVGAETHPLASGWWWLDRFTYWDSFHFTRVADDGSSTAKPVDRPQS